MYNSLRELGIEAERKGKAEMSGDTKSGKIKTLMYRVMTPIVFNIQTRKSVAVLSTVHSELPQQNYNKF